MAVNIHITIIELNALHTKRQNLFQELDAVIHLLMEAKHWADGGRMNGGPDAGPTLDGMCADTSPTRFLADTTRGRKLVPLEGAVELMPEAPAELFGLNGRGTLTEGFHADIAIVDPDTVG